MRADFYPDLMTSDLWPIDLPQRLEVVPLQGQALRQAIQQPAQQVGVYPEGELIERLLADAAGEPGVLPLLQETMVLLWGKMSRRLLTLRDYEQLGGEGRSGLAVAMAHKADGTLAGLDSEQQAMARRIFLRLVQFGEGRTDTRRQQTATQLTPGGEAGMFQETLEVLVNNRLLTQTGEEQGEGKKVDISHEALIAGWPTLQTWITERREKEKIRRRLEEKAEEWTRLGKTGGLLDEVEVAEAEQWLQSPDAAALGHSAELVELVHNSRTALEKAKKKLRNRFIFASLLAGVAAVAAVVSFFLYGKSEQQRQLALARQLAAQSQLERGIAGELLVRSTLLAVESLRRQPAPNLAGDLVVRRGLALLRPELARLHHLRTFVNFWVKAVTFSPDGQVLATAGNDWTARLWDRQGKELARLNHEGDVWQVVFSPDGQVLATASLDRTARLWDRQGNELARLHHEDEVGAVAFSSDGQVLATASADKTAWLWDRQGNELARLHHEDEVWQVIFSPDGQVLATASDDETARLWDRQGKELARLSHEDRVWAVAFSPDGQVLATASKDKTARLWDRQGQELARLTQEDKVNAVVFSPDGQVLATAGDDKTARLWNRQGRELARLTQEDKVNAVAFSPDGQVLATAGDDKTARLWNRQGRELARLTQEDKVNAVAFSPDGQVLATAGDDKTTRLWDRQGRELARLTHEGWVTAVVFSPDGQVLATASQDRTVRLWDRQGQELARLNHEAMVNKVVFSPDGQVLATAGWDKTARLWLRRPEDLIGEACRLLPRNLTREEWRQYLGEEPYRKTCGEKK